MDRDSIPAVVRLMNEPSVALWTLHIPFPYTARDARAYVQRSGRNRRAGRSLGLGIVRRRDRALLGGVGFQNFVEEAARAEVGYWLGREHRGQGYASEALQVLLRVGFTRLGLHRVEARVYPRNRASRALLRRNGFRYEGRLRDEVQKNGRWQSTLLYSRIVTDPPLRS